MKILILSLVFMVNFSFAEPTPWWEVSYNLDIKYPKMGDYKWEHNSEKIIVKGEGENRRSFYKIDLALGDTIIYLDSSVFNYKGEDISIVNWNFSKYKISYCDQPMVLTHTVHAPSTNIKNAITN